MEMDMLADLLRVTKETQLLRTEKVERPARNVGATEQQVLVLGKQHQLRRAAESLRANEQVMTAAIKADTAFYTELFRLMLTWRLRRSGKALLLDHSWAGCGSPFAADQALAEVHRKTVAATQPTSTFVEGAGLFLQIAPRFRAVARITVSYGSEPTSAAHDAQFALTLPAPPMDNPAGALLVARTSVLLQDLFDNLGRHVLDAADPRAWLDPAGNKAVFQVWRASPHTSTTASSLTPPPLVVSLALVHGPLTSRGTCVCGCLLDTLRCLCVL